MSFKEFRNPEGSNYDITSGSNREPLEPPMSPVVDNPLNDEEGIDLNALDEPPFQINEYGEIIRNGKTR